MRHRFPPRLRSVLCLAFLGSSLTSVMARSLSAQAIPQVNAIVQPDRLRAHADFTPVTQMAHQLPAWVQPGQQSAATPIALAATLKVSFVLRRDPSVQAAFEQLLADQQEPSSPLYHRWLTPRQVGTMFGTTANDLAVFTSWLTSQGLKVDSVAPNGVVVDVSGSAAAFSNALHTNFANFQVGSDVRLSATVNPSIPTVLIPLVSSIQGLSELRLRPMSRSRPVQGIAVSAPWEVPTRPLFTNSGEYFVMPADFATIYDINSVYSVGNKGATVGSKAQHIAVIGESRVTDTDITQFESIAGLPSVTPNVLIPTGATDPGTTATGVQDEATLDVDRVIATAPGATVDLVVAADTNTESGIIEAITYNINTLLDPIMTISFGACEAQAGSANVDLVDSYAATAAAEGITTLVSSGDSGAAGCDISFRTAPATQVASINFLCSSSYVTCVGGTEFNDTSNPSLYWSSSNGTNYVSALSYIPEGAWNEPDAVNGSTVSYAPASTGGGVSSYILKPAWQTGFGVPSDGFRDVPDVSFSSSAHDGYFGCLAYAGGNCAKGYFESFSGTSAAAPGMAGVVALVNTKLGISSGNINPLLYSLAASSPVAFHDVTVASSGVSGCTTDTPSMCNNSTPGPSTLIGGLAGYSVATGYDLATGLGSIDVANLISLSVPPVVQGTFTLSSDSSTLTVKAGATSGNVSTISGVSLGGFAGKPALSCMVAVNGAGSAAIPPTCNVTPSILIIPQNGTTGTLTITSSAATTTGCTATTTPQERPWTTGATGIVLAGLLLLLPFRKWRSMRALAMLCLLSTGLAVMSGCGGSGSSSSACVPTPISGTTPGAYTVTITGIDGPVTSSIAVNLAVN